MNTHLTVSDPLADKEVTIIITLAVGERPRDERPAMVTVGVAEQFPVIQTGTFADVPGLIDEAWTAFAVRAQMTKVVPTSETVTTEQVVATAVTDDDDDDDDDEPAPKPKPPFPLPTPKPQAKNLSLF